MKKVVFYCILFIIPILLLVWAYTLYNSSQNFREMFLENKQLRVAVENLTTEEAVAYLKVISQEKIEGQLLTIVKFIEVFPDKKSPIRIERQYKIKGDIVYVDALIVKFEPKIVQVGKEKALFLWRRLYDEGTSPAQAFPLNVVSEEPQVYKEVFQRLNFTERQTFWKGIWQLADSPNALKDLGIQAIYGSAVYQKVTLGKIYEYRINRQGQITPIVHPEL